MPRLLQKSWLDSYLDYIDNTENPRDYNLWAAISAISSSMKRNIYIWRNFVQYFPNQYIILVGPPGIGKGSAIHPVIKIVKEAGLVNYLSDKITAEKIIEKLAVGFAKAMPAVSPTGQGTLFTIGQDHTACILAKELPVFLSSSEWMHSLLCQLWDENTFEYETKNKGSSFIKDMCVSMLAGCVPDFIRKMSRDALAPVTGGFTARTIFVYATEKAQLLPEGWGRPQGTTSQLYDMLLNDLKHISRLSGEMRLSIDAQRLWNQTYAIHNKQGELDTDAAANFKSRISAHVIKTAMSVSVAEADDLVITKAQLERAITYVETVRDKVDVIFRAVGESPLAVIQDKVITLLEDQGILARDTILRRLYRHTTDDQLTQVLFTLERSNMVILQTIGDKTVYKLTF